MYSDPNLDNPPPRSQFRRPWSPEAYDHHGLGDNSHNRWDNNQYHVQSEQGHQHRQQRREASDVSVEALDLADYSRTLRTRQAGDPYPEFPSRIQPQAHYPPSSFPVHPQWSGGSRESQALHPPSLVSRGPTLSSNGTHHTSSSAPSPIRNANRRPFSLPATPHNSSQASSSRVRLEHSPRGPPYVMDPTVNLSTDEIDISNFPKWSRGWYNSNNSKSRPEPDIYTPLPTSHLNSAKKQSPFDPGYVHDSYGTYNSDPYNAYDLPPPLSSLGGDSRDMLPWSNDPPEYGPPLDPMLKEERMRMLEREFGNNGKKKGKDLGKSFVDEDGKPLVGTVDEKGNLVTSGPKRRITFRALQIILAIGACIPAIYAAVAIKSSDPRQDPPPPANKPPVFVLYILSSLTLLLLLYMFLIRPCCCMRKSKSSPTPSNLGMMVLPVGGPPGKKNKKPKGGKKGKGKYGPQGQGDVQVNLIVDPNAFQRPDADESDSDDDDDDSLEGSMPGSYERRKKRNRRRKRRGVFEGLKMEEEWRAARKWAKKVTMVDVAGLVFWSAAFVYIMTGKKCPSGMFDGWCTAYNTSVASACLLAVAFGVSLFFDVQDLHSSKQSPRTRS